jgi:hypothetical protein
VWWCSGILRGSNRGGRLTRTPENDFRPRCVARALIDATDGSYGTYGAHESHLSRKFQEIKRPSRPCALPLLHVSEETRQG